MTRAVLIIGSIGLVLTLAVLPLDRRVESAFVVDVMAMIASAAVTAIAVFRLWRRRRAAGRLHDRRD